MVTYPLTDSTVNPVRCSGEGSAPSTQALITDADPTSTFTYANAGGRDLSFAAGTGTLGGPAAVPAGVPAKAWASMKLSAVALHTAVASSTDRRAVYRFAQSRHILAAETRPFT